MGKNNGIERNKLDYLLTDILPVEVSELFSFGKFYEYLMTKQNDIEGIVNELQSIKAKNNSILFKGGWDTVPLKYNILKGVNGCREINIVQPLSALNIYLFICCYQNEILSFLNSNSVFSLRYHRKNTDLFYKKSSHKITEYFYKISKKIDKSVLQQTGAYFKIQKFNSVSSFTKSKLWQQCNFKFKYFAKADYKSCFDSIYSHSYKWIIEKNTIDSKSAVNSNLFITIDRILQNINGKSSNGVIVGPEFSRMIAEILLQEIDVEIERNLRSKKIIIGMDYRIFRYVDDIYIFAKTPEIINIIIEVIQKTSQKYLLKLNDLKYLKAETPVILNDWLKETRLLTDKISDLFYSKNEMHNDKTIACMVKSGYISLDRIKNEFTILMDKFPASRRYIVSYILSTLLNNISSKKEGYKLFEDNKTGRAFVFLDFAMYIYSFCPCFEHTQRLISMIVYFDDELDFKNDIHSHRKLINILRRYNFVYENANLNDICNWFIFFYEFKISLFPKTEKIICEKIVSENNPILWANYLIYSQYEVEYNEEVLELLEDIIIKNIDNLLSVTKEKLLQKEFWYVLIFCNCPYISFSTKRRLKDEIDSLHSSPTSVEAKALNLIFNFLNQDKLNLFFYWGYYKFDTSKQLTYRTYQRTLFKQYKKNKNIELYGSLDS